MKSPAVIDDMGVDNIGFLIENLGHDTDPLQFLRELVQNGIEAIQKKSQPGQIIVDHETVRGVAKLRITDNGIGMTEEEVRLNINHLSASGGTQALNANFGIGAKIAAGMRNPEGLVYKAWKHGCGCMTILGRHEGRYGRLAFPNADGTVEFSLPLPPESKHEIVDDSGVSVVLLGRTAAEDTTLAPPGADLPSQWISAYLERRYFELPSGITIKVRGREIFDSERGEKRAIADTIRGQRYYLDKHSDHHDVVDLPEAYARVWWWILNDKIVKGGKTWNNSGHVSALYQGEMYEVQAGNKRTSALKDFGIYAGYQRIVIYVEPTNVLKADAARSSLRLESSQRIDYPRIGELFASDMPAQVAAFMAGQVSSEAGDNRAAIRKNLQEVEKELDVARYRRSETGALDHYEPEFGGERSTADPGDEMEEAPRRRRREDAGGRLGEQYLRKAREEQSRQQRAERVDADPMPRIVWDETGENTRAGRAATYTNTTHIITANARFSFYLDMVQWAMDDARPRIAGEADESALRELCEKEIRRWFEEALTDAVVVLRPKSHDADWGPKVFETGLSDDGLTAAVVSHRWLMMSAIRREFGLRFRAKREAAVVA